jgi:hypothetical protein
MTLSLESPMRVLFSHAAHSTQKLMRLSGGLLAVAVLLSGNFVLGQEAIKIEEDWKLVVSQPDPDTQAPQVTTTFSPVGNLDSVYAVFDVNLRNIPSYEAGGVQFQLWHGTTSLFSKKQNTGTLLQVPDETLTWTQRISIDGGQLTLEVVNGKSQTWGDFGGLSFVTETDLTNLNAYDMAVSLANSGVGYSSNRVTSLTLTAIRAYSAGGLIGQDTNPKVVFPRQ